MPPREHDTGGGLSNPDAGTGEVALLPEMPAGRLVDQNGGGSRPNAREPGWKFGFAVAVLEDPAAAGSPRSPGAPRWGGV